MNRREGAGPVFVIVTYSEPSTQWAAVRARVLSLLLLLTLSRRRSEPPLGRGSCLCYCYLLCAGPAFVIVTYSEPMTQWAAVRARVLSLLLLLTLSRRRSEPPLGRGSCLCYCYLLWADDAVSRRQGAGPAFVIVTYSEPTTQWAAVRARVLSLLLLLTLSRRRSEPPSARGSCLWSARRRTSGSQSAAATAGVWTRPHVHSRRRSRARSGDVRSASVWQSLKIE